MSGSKPLGEVLVDERLITREQLQEAIERQRETGKPIGKVLLEMGAVTEEALVEAVARQIGVPYVDLAMYPPPSNIARLVPRELALKHVAIPAELQAGTLIVAMAEPTNQAGLREIATVTGYECRPALALRHRIVEIIESLAAPPPPEPEPVPYVEPSVPSAPAAWTPPPSPVVDDAPRAPEPAAPSFAERLRAASEPYRAAQPDVLGDPLGYVVGAPTRAKTTDKELSMHELLERLIEERGSDLHLTSGTQPTIRVNGALMRLEDYPVMRPGELRRMIYSILTQRQREQLEETMELDMSYQLTGRGRFRVNVYFQRDSIGAAIRMIPFEIKSLKDLGLPAKVAEFAHMPRGLVLVTGPTGSGKSTTLAAIIDIANSEREDHILTIEDPIEYVHKHKRALVNQREVGGDTHSFSAALKHALRQDPDVILVGEMRDLETISTALTAAETGHLVFGTLHTQSAPEAIDRVIDVFPPHQQQQVRVQLAATLQAVVTQQLLKTIDGQGRVLAAEVMIATPAVRNLVREGKTHMIYSSMQSGSAYGMLTMDQSLADLVKKKLITFELGLERCHNAEDFTRLCGRM